MFKKRERKLTWYEAAQTTAAIVLEEYWGPSKGMRVDPEDIARQMGIHVLHTTLPINISGMIIKGQEGYVAISLSKYEHADRNRFNCSHLIGHYLIHEFFPNSLRTEQFLHVDSKHQHRTELECFADEFAASLLMPTPAMVALIGRTRRASYSSKTAAKIMGVTQGVFETRAANIERDSKKLE